MSTAKNKKSINSRIQLFLCSVVLALLLPALNVFFAVYALQYALVFIQYIAFFLAIGIYTYFYLLIEPKVTHLFFDIFKWKRWIFYPVYYIALDIYYRFAYNIYLAYITKGNQFMFVNFGAFLSYTFRIFELIILYQIALKNIRNLVLFIYRKIKEKYNKK